jgi:hypothetical protein
MTYTEDQCKKDTIEHINQVREFMAAAVNELLKRSFEHDESKLESPELEIFTEFTPKIQNSTYGSDEYKSFLKEMNVALEHHYANNSHHPEHYKKHVCNGCFKEYKEIPDHCDVCGYSQFQAEADISQMNLFDIIEMVCDWKAAVMRHKDGDIYKSLDISKDRFKISDQLHSILKNTVDYFESE